MPRIATRDFKSSLLFDGAVSTVIVPHNANQLLTTGFTISAWIKPKSIGETTGRIVDKSTADTAAGGFRYALNSSNALFFQVNTGSSIASATNSILYNNTWYHVVVTVGSDATVTHYINGVLSGTPATTGALSGITTTNNLTIGNRSGATDRTFDGNMTDIIIWNTALTATQVSSLYFGNQVPTTTLIGRWRFNEGAGSTANDSSTIANNGTITSATFSSDVPIKLRSVTNHNLVFNGDFEYAPPFSAAQTASSTWIDGTAAGSSTNDLFGWAPTKGGTAAVQFDNTVRYSGSYSLKVSTTATASFVEARTLVGTVNMARMQQYGIPVLPSTTYKLSYKMKTNYVSGDSSDGAGISVLEYTVAASSATTDSTTRVKTTTDWTDYSLNFTTTSTSRYIVVYCLVYGHTGTATLIMDAWFDDIVVTPLYPLVMGTNPLRPPQFNSTARLKVGQNMVVNGDFAAAPVNSSATTTISRWINGNTIGGTDPVDHAFGWYYVRRSGAGTGSAMFDSNTVRPGSSSSYSMKMTASGNTGRIAIRASSLTGTSWGTNNQYFLRAQPNTSYTATIWVKTSGLGASGGSDDVNVTVQEVTVVNFAAATTRYVARNITTNQDWTQYSLTFTTGATTAYFDILMEMAVIDGTAWFDSVTLTPTALVSRSTASTRSTVS
jgi:hypothetical protein